jgi:hypothetical protein
MNQSFAPRILLAGSIFLACGGKTLDLGRDLEPPEYAGPESGRGGAAPSGPTPVATHQYGGDALVLDESRVYWSTTGPAPSPDLPSNCWTCEESFVLRSCAKNDCAGTLVTYWRSPEYQVQIGVNQRAIYWIETKPGESTAAVLSCPLAGCDGRPTILISEISSWAMVVDDSNVYWLSTDATIFRCSVDGCRGNPAIVTQADGARVGITGILAATATHLYWAAQTNDRALSGRIMTMPKDGSAPARVVADGLHRPQSIAVDAQRVYFTEGYSFGSVKSCPLAGCTDSPAEIASQQRYPALLAVHGDRAYWFTTSLGPPSFWQRESGAYADLVSCHIRGCEGAPTVLATRESGPHALGVDPTHLYWTRYGETKTGPSGFYNDGAVMRMRR